MNMRLAMFALALIAIAMAALLAAVYLCQRSLLYFPQRARVEDMLSVHVRPWPESGDFRGLLAEPPGPVRATILIFHGNAGHAGHREFYADVLCRLGLRVLLAEYPGYGPRSGSASERTLTGDAVASIDLALQRYGAPLLVAGESLGAGVAAAAAARRPDAVSGLLLITPWDRLAGPASHHYPWLPVEWLLRDRYDSIAALAHFGKPVVVAIAAADSIIPPRFGEALFASLPGPKSLRVIADAGHNDWPARVDAGWWRQAIDFALGRELGP